MSEIPFTQYLLPDGRKRETGIDRPDEVAAKAQRIIDAGHRFEAEVLTTGDVSLTIHNIADEEDVAIKVVPNGPGVGEAVDELVKSFEVPA